MKPPVLSRPDTIRRRLKNTGHAGQIGNNDHRENYHDICDELDELRARIEKAERYGMALADDLRKARALIDTPEKLGGRSVAQALDDAIPQGGALGAFVMVLEALERADTGSIRGRIRVSHADILALFDRAIATAESQE